MDCGKTNDLLKLLDTVVIKLEGGTEEDISLLEQEYTGSKKIDYGLIGFKTCVFPIEMEERNKEQQKSKEETTVEKPKETENGNNNNNNNSKKEEGEIESENTKTDENEPKTNGEHKDEIKLDDDDDGDVKIKEEKESENSAKEEIKQLDEKMDIETEDGEEIEKKDEENTTTEERKDAEEKNDQEDAVVEPEEQQKDKPEKKNDKKRKRSFSGSSGGSSSSSSDSEDEENKPEKVEKDKKEDKEIIEDEKIETVEDDKPEKPKSLHKTTSIFLRNLAPTITKQEVEAMCQRYEGFLRVALADPQPERRWLRRGWVTFKRDANIKEICWNLNNIRLRECELGAIVNRDLSRRIRPVNGITAHKQVVRSDIRISARVVLHLDTKAGLWPDDDEKTVKQQQTFGLVSNNPVLHNITDYLIEEASAEEEELLGLEPSAENQDSISTVERDESLITVLDRIILYLRIVHSVDYYNHCEYPNEDEMPNRCGILHARGPPPTTKTDMTQFIGAPVEQKMVNFLPEKPRDENNKNEMKLISLSLKDVDTEIDKFVQANTRELAKDKWLCPLSGKKFKGPDFVRKHIFNKHAEKLDEVRKEVEFFNNYLKDPKRPMLAEAPQTKREEAPSYNHPSYVL